MAVKIWDYTRRFDERFASIADDDIKWVRDSVYYDHPADGNDYWAYIWQTCCWFLTDYVPEIRFDDAANPNYFSLWVEFADATESTKFYLKYGYE